MRRSVFLIVGCMLSLLLGAVPALADNGPHVKGQGLTPDTCAACHRAHTGQAPYLLKEKQEQLCFSCHGTGATGSNLDVQDGTAYSGAARSGGAVGALRGGGFKYALINTAEPKPVYNPETGRLNEATIPALATTELKATTSAHSANESSQMAWGSGAIKSKEAEEHPDGANINLTCGSCHDPHGNGMYRILRPIPVEATAKTGVEITEPKEMAKEYATTNYWESWNNNDPEFEYKISEWCATCHTRLYEGAGSGSGATNSGDPVFAYRHRASYTKEEYETLKHATGGKKAKPNCIQCHVAHGTDATMGGNSTSVTLPNGLPSSPTEPINGDSFLLRLNNRGVCQTCHNK